MKPEPAKEDTDAKRATSSTLDVLARQQGVRPIVSGDELRADIWEPDEELDAFLTHVRQWRDSDLAGDPGQALCPEPTSGTQDDRPGSASTLEEAMDDEDQDEFRHSSEYIKSLRERAGMTLEEVAERAGVEPAWLDNIERNGTHDLLYSEICNLVRATQPPRPEWWDEGYEHDLNLGPNAVVGPLTPSQQEYWARIEAVRAEIRRHYERGRRASA